MSSRSSELSEKACSLSKNLQYVRNIGISAHIDAGKTTLSDNLLAGSGLMSSDTAGKQRLLDYDDQESERGITINAASASMIYPYKHNNETNEYLINLIDTPGHVDFSGDVTRAMRALDGVIIVVCGVEGVMAQTKTVIRQAMKEKVRPILFINKVDRLITELKLSPQEISSRMAKIVIDVNKLMRASISEELYEKWKIIPNTTNLTFGSAYHNWAYSMNLNSQGVSFKDVYDACAKKDLEKLQNIASLYKIVLEAVIQNIDNPIISQKIKIPSIWSGDLESDIGKAMLAVDSTGPAAAMINKVLVDPHAGQVCCGRIFSGTLKKGDMLYVGNSAKPQRIQTVGIVIGDKKIILDEVHAGNIVTISGIPEASTGSTLSSERGMVPFESIVHYTDPVITKSVKAKNTRDITKLLRALSKIRLADPSIVIASNSDTGENLISGMGELHLEITEYRIINEYGIDIEVSPPIVLYKEKPSAESAVLESKSRNRLNKFLFKIVPLTVKQCEYLREHSNPEFPILKRPNLVKEMVEAGFERSEVKRIISIERDNIFIDKTKGVQYLDQVLKMIQTGFKEVCEQGPLGNEQVTGMKVEMVDAFLHQVSQCRTEYQIIKAVTNGLRASLIQAKIEIEEPYQAIEIDVPSENSADCISVAQTRRGSLDNIKQKGNNSILYTSIPVSETFGFSAEIRAASKGHAIWSTSLKGFFPIKNVTLADNVIKSIRIRKGLPEEVPTVSSYIK